MVSSPRWNWVYGSFSVKDDDRGRAISAEIYDEFMAETEPLDDDRVSQFLKGDTAEFFPVDSEARKMLATPAGIGDLIEVLYGYERSGKGNASWGGAIMPLGNFTRTTKWKPTWDFMYWVVRKRVPLRLSPSVNGFYSEDELLKFLSWVGKGGSDLLKDFLPLCSGFTRSEDPIEYMMFWIDSAKSSLEKGRGMLVVNSLGDWLS